MSQADPADFTGIVVAAGRAERFGGPLPKQFLTLAGRWVVEHSIDALADHASVATVVVVLASEHARGAFGRRLLAHPRVSAVVEGGANRSDSVAAGLAAADPACRYVLVHDAARPLASKALVARVIDATRKHGAAIPALPPPDTIKRVAADGGIEATLDRERLRVAQTPQGAVRKQLADALAACGPEAPTDEAAALERAGHRVATVEGDPENIKITRAADLELVRRGLEGPVNLRVGSGFDIHRIDVSRPLILGGVLFENEPGLAGHSDADVILHAAMDAVLGAAGEGDIGHLFPPDEDRWAGADSFGLAEAVAGKIAAAGYRVVNLDLTLLAERPKIGPRSDEIRTRVASAFGIEPGRVGLKATTLEKLGSLGRHEGIACQAVALLARVDS